ncbi:MAG: molybdopterin-guanine dinucleotide biosynthesis protein B [Candidatus Thorarchaeota archaeon]
MRVFAISGYSRTGKTTLVEAIVRSLVDSGYSVATIKSSKHDPGPEHGTDTWRHKQAGATVTLFHKSDRENLNFRDIIRSEDLTKLVEHDFLIIEGMKSVDIPRLWCIGENDLILDDVPPNTQAIITWSERPNLISDIPVITNDDVGQLTDIVIRNAREFSELE